MEGRREGGRVGGWVRGREGGRKGGREDTYLVDGPGSVGNEALVATFRLWGWGGRNDERMERRREGGREEGQQLEGGREEGREGGTWIGPSLMRQ